jgi:hypothetical protein
MLLCTKVLKTSLLDVLFDSNLRGLINQKNPTFQQ